MIRSTVDVQRKLTIHACKGPITAEQIEEAVKSFYDGKPTQNTIWDCSEGDLSAITPEEVRDLASLIKKIAHSREGGKSALVAPKDVSFGIGRMYQSLAEIYEQTTDIGVFRTRAEAERWISEK